VVAAGGAGVVAGWFNGMVGAAPVVAGGWPMGAGATGAGAVRSRSWTPVVDTAVLDARSESTIARNMKIPPVHHDSVWRIVTA
jgi:hypothetical protein